MNLPRPNIKRPNFKRPSLKLPSGRGPSFSAPRVDVPKPVADLYADLRDKRLLPVMAALVLAMIAVPFVFGESSDVDEAPVAASAPSPAVTGPGTLTVVEAPDPGLRDYEKRLGGTEKNPFKQQYTSVPQSAQLKSTTSSDNGGGGDSASVSVTETGSGTEVDVDVPSSGGGGGSPDIDPKDVPSGAKFFGFRPDVRFGKAGSGKLAKHDELAVGSVLPKKRGAVVFLGVTENGQRAFFAVSPRIVSVKGDGSCIGGKQSCEVLSLKAGQAVTLVGAQPLPVYRLSVVDIELVEIEEKKRAAKAGSSSMRESLGSLQRVRRFSK